MGGARMASCAIKYSETIVGIGNNSYPLRTDITIDLRVWTIGEVQRINGQLPLDPAWY